jgi:hypothetical protein
MAAGLFTPALEAIDPETVPLSFPAGVPRERAMALAAAAPSNQQVIDACKAAYGAHQPAVDGVTTGSVDTAQSKSSQSDLDALHTYDWSRQVAAPALATPIYQAATMAQARAAVDKDGAFATFFVGVDANIDFIVGGGGGVGVGLGIPTGQPLWMAWGGLRIGLNIDIAVNLDCGIFLEPPSEVAGDYLGLEISAEPIAEGPSIGFGIHMSPDLSKVRGFSISVGVELGILPFNVVVVSGSIATALGPRPGVGMRPAEVGAAVPPPHVRQMGALA